MLIRSKTFHIVHFLVLYLIFHINGWAGDEPAGLNGSLFFKKITVKDGLSQASANCFLEDRLGFMWVGTDEGLNRYDGVSFTTYRWNKGNINGLSNSTILALAEDAEGNIWIGTAEGLNKYDIKNQKFTQYLDATSNNYYNELLIDSASQKIWLAANAGGLKYLNFQTDEIEVFGEFKNKESIVRQFLKINDTELLIGTIKSGIYKLNTSTSEVSPYLNATKGKFKIPNNKITQLVMHEDQLVIGFDGEGICLYNLKNSQHKIFNKENSTLSSNLVYSIGYDADYNLLIGTDGGGLNILSYSDQSIKTYKVEQGNPRSISADVIRTIYLDSHGNNWIGTYYGGINFVSRSSKGIIYHGKEFLNNNSLSNNSVTGFQEDKSGGIWIGTNGGGLNYFKDGQFSVISAGDSRDELNDLVVLCLDIAEDGSIVIGTFNGGLNVYNSGIIHKYLFDENDPDGISDNWIWDIDIDAEGNYWLGTNNGLNKFDPKTKKFKTFKPMDDFTYLDSRNNIRSLLIDSNEDLWVGTFEGFGKFNLVSEEFEYFISTSSGNGLNNDIIVSIFEDSNKNIWIGTIAGGISLFEREIKTFKTYDENEGLPNNSIQSIEEDAHGNLWISTANGIVKFNPRLETFDKMGTSFGLQGEVFKHNSSLKSSDGYMYFGGVNGFNVFHPDSVYFPESSNTIILSDFQIFNQSINSESHGHILSKSISYTDEISLKYDESRFFSIHFTVPNYINPDKIKFAYKLEGFDEEWNYIGDERKVTFTSLNPKNYVMKIKASPDKNWQEEYTELRLNIIPPFYLRNGFIVFSIITLISLIISVFKYRSYIFRKRQVILENLVDQKNIEIKTQNDELKNQNIQLTKAQKQLQKVNNTLEEKVKRRTKKLDVTIDKLNKSVKELDRFVYSASHDLSAPLKSIQGLINLVKLENKDDNIVMYLDYIEKSVLKLENVIRDLIQFSRNSRSELKYSEINLVSFVNEIITSLKFQPEFDQFKFDISIAEDVTVKSDQQRLHMIIHNLLSNAIKYQDKEKPLNWAKIKYLSDGNSWILEVKDNGIGISKEHKKKVFKMFYRATELSEGSGLGLFIVKEAIEKLDGKVLLKSEMNFGSKFKIEFPVKA